MRGIFLGTRMTDGTVSITFTAEGARPVRIDPRNDLWNHSPDGFEWGYAGSGPAQTALGILAYYFRSIEPDGSLADALAIRLHQEFKFALVATIPRTSDLAINTREIEMFTTAHADEINALRADYRLGKDLRGES